MTGPVVRDWMHEGVIVCAPETPLPEVAQTMKTHQISALVVVNTDGLALGVISRTDLANASFVEPYMRHWRGMTARHLMTSPVISVGAGTPVATALETLKTRKIHRLVVTEAVAGGEKPIGILSLTDVVRHVDPLGGGLRPPSDTSPHGLRGQSPRSRP